MKSNNINERVMPEVMCNIKSHHQHFCWNLISLLKGLFNLLFMIIYLFINYLLIFKVNDKQQQTVTKLTRKNVSQKTNNNMDTLWFVELYWLSIHLPYQHVYENSRAGTHELWNKSKIVTNYLLTLWNQIPWVYHEFIHGVFMVKSWDFHRLFTGFSWA